MKIIFVVITSVIALLQGSITLLSAAEESYQFSPGANLFAYPVDPGSTYSATDFLTELNTHAEVSSIQHYNTEKGLFETCVWKNNIASGADFPIQTEEGYIVHTLESFVYQVSGDRICPQISLVAGLNTAAFPCVPSGYDVYQLLQDLGPAVTAVKTQEPDDGIVLTATRENDIINGDHFSIEHGHSYLVYMDSGASWFPSALPLPPGNSTGYAGDQLAILTWSSPSENILGYNVYRTATSGSNYTQLNTELLHVTEYTDQALTNGTTWYYVISAIDRYGRESALSSEVAVTPANTGPTVINAGTEITTNTTWNLAGSPYTINNSITLAAGVTLTLEPGVIVKFNTGRFNIDGGLVTEGTPDHPIVFQADGGTWTGLRFVGPNSTNSVLEYCRVEQASYPVYIEDSSPEISHCEIIATGSRGIQLFRSNSHIHHTGISGSYSYMYGLYLTDSSPLIEYNDIQSPGYGIYMSAASTPQVLYNSITEFSRMGIDMSASYPVISGNTIETSRGSSSTYLIRTNSYDNNPAAGVHRSINAQNNYWGTAEPQIIAISIDQWHGGTDSHPYVDFSNFLDSPNGSVVPGHFIPSGPISADELNWTPETGPYIILGHALVDSGDELTIAPGTEVLFAGGGEVYGYRRDLFSSLNILGKLTAVGNENSLIHLLSKSPSPEKSDWYGIVFLENYVSSSAVSYCKIEHAYRGVVCIGGSAAITHNTIIAGNDHGESYAAGIRLEANNTSTVSSNSISDYNYYDSSGIYIRGSSSPVVNDNTLENNRNGIFFHSVGAVSAFSTAQITSNVILNSTVHSIYLYGSNSDTTNPQPTIHNNILVTPSVPSNSFRTTSYGSGTTIIINAQNNWWGTYDAAAIAIKVYDKNDADYLPYVDYRFFLNAETGSPGTGNQVLGSLAANTDITWSIGNSPYIIIGDLNIPATSSLTLEAGIEIWMSSGESVNVDGKLIVNGTELNPVRFSAGNMIDTPAEWEGIRLIGAVNDDTVLSYCHIENAKTPLYIENSSPEISHCEILAAASTNYTVRLISSNAHIHHNTVSSTFNSDYGLYLENSSSLIEYNLISGMHDAIYLEAASSPQILHNTLLDFSYTGIVCYGYGGNPNPVMHNNTLQTSQGDYYTWLIRTSYYENDPLNGTVQTINATGNYWGTSDPQKINAAIDQWSGSATNTDPIVDFSGFLDNPDGSPVNGHFIPPGMITELSWQPAQGPYIVLGHAFLPNGQELTIAPGTEVRFLGGSEAVLNTTRDVRSSLRIYGKLTASGTAESEIHFYSNHNEPTMGDWSGIFFYDSADDTSIISYSTIEHAYNSVYCTGASPEISNNTIIAGPGSASYVYGLRLEAGSDATITDNHISGFDEYYTYNGIYILDSSPTISGNITRDNYYGIHLKNGSPTITGNTIEHNKYGIGIYADSNTVSPSAPTINNNAIVDNTSYSVYISGYSSGDNSTNPRPVFTNNSILTQYSPTDSFYTTYYNSSNLVTINAENNWWGTSNSSEIIDIIRDHSDTSSAPSVDFEPFLSESPTPLLYNPAVSREWISPNNDGTQEDVTITWQGSPDISNWTVNVKDSSGTIVRTESVGSLLTWTWDGKDNSNNPVADGHYTVTITGSNANGTVERETEIITVDTVEPVTVQINSPSDAQVLQNIFDIVVTVQDDNINNYTLEIGKGVSPASWRQLTTGSANLDQATLYTFESNTSDTDTIPSLSPMGELTDGPYTIRLTATDLAGNTYLIERNITLENIFITSVSVTELIVDLTINQSASMQFAIDKTADVVLRIYTESEGNTDQLVRVITQSSLAAGTHSFTWDGRNDSAEYVDVGGYIFVLSASTGSGLTDQFIPERTLNIPASWTPASSFDSAANIWFTADVTMANVPGHYRVRITPSGEDEFSVYTNYYAAHESFIFTWDGRRPDGSLVDVNTSFWIHDTWGNARMFIVRSSSAPIISGPAPAINIKSNPYLVNFCYGEQTSIVYNLDRAADVTITLLPVPLTDTASPEAILVLDNQQQNAGDHIIAWDATDSTDIRNVLFSQEGLYTFIIEATSAGITSTSRGVVSLYK